MRADGTPGKRRNENGSDSRGPWYRKEERAKQHDAAEYRRQIGRQAHLCLRVGKQVWSKYAHTSVG